MIKKFNLATAGRNGNYDAKGSDEASSNEPKVANASMQVIIWEVRQQEMKQHYPSLAMA